MVEVGVRHPNPHPVTTEIHEVRPNRFLVSRCGDRPENGAFDARDGIEYRIPERRAGPGLDARTSTQWSGY